jgi:uncharacterized membrane protein
MKKKSTYFLLILLSLLPFVITWFALPYFPQTIPTHYDFAGNPDTFSAKTNEYVLAVVFSLSGFVMLLIAFLVNKFHPEDEESTVKASNNALLVAKCGIAMMFLFLVIQCSELLNVYYYVNQKGSFDDLKITNIALLLLFIYLGNIVTKSKKNSAIGIRTSWSMESEQSWSVSQRVGGITLILTTLPVIIISLILPEQYQLAILLVAPIFIFSITIFAAYRAVSKQKNVDK